MAHNRGWDLRTAAGYVVLLLAVSDGYRAAGRMVRWWERDSGGRSGTDRAVIGRLPMCIRMTCGGQQEMVSSKEQSGVETRVLSVVTEVLAIEGDAPALDSSLIEDLGADSLDLLSLFMALEDEFGDTISEEETEGLATLRDIVECISGRLGETAAASQS